MPIFCRNMLAPSVLLGSLTLASGLATPALAEDAPPQPTATDRSAAQESPARTDAQGRAWTAQTGGRPGGPGPGGGLAISLQPSFEHTFEGELRDGDGKVSITRAGLNLRSSLPLREKLRLTFDAGYEHSSYRFKDVDNLLPGGVLAGGKDPIKDAFLLRFSPGLAWSLNESWTLVGGGIFEFAGEYDASFSDAATFGGYFGASYRVDETLSFTFGAIVKTRLEDDALFVPLLGLRWQINDKLALNTEGLGVRLSAKVSEPLSVSLFARYELRDYRLADDSPIPEGIVRDGRVPVGATISYRFSPQFELSASAGAIVYQRYTFDDRNGNRVESDKTRAAPFVGIRGEISF